MTGYSVGWWRARTIAGAKVARVGPVVVEHNSRRKVTVRLHWYWLGETRGFLAAEVGVPREDPWWAASVEFTPPRWATNLLDRLGPA